jgi:Predicted secreted protein (DUF2259)
MKTSRLIILLSAILLLSYTKPETKDQDRYPGPQEYWKYTFHGFSPDLVVTAFESTRDSELEPSHELYVVTVDKNDYATSPYRIAMNELPAEAEDSIRKVIDNKLGHFKLPVKAGYKRMALHGSEATITVKGEPYKLKLIQTEIPGLATDWDYSAEGAQGEVLHSGVMKFELDLIHSASGKTWVLQKDNTLPKSRGFVKRYRLKDAYVQDNKIAVMLEFDLESQKDAESYYSYQTKYMMVTAVAK